MCRGYSINDFLYLRENSFVYFEVQASRGGRGEGQSGSNDIVTEASGRNENSSFNRFLHRNVGEAPLTSCRGGVGTTPHESAVDLNLPFKSAGPEAVRIMMFRVAYTFVSFTVRQDHGIDIQRLSCLTKGGPEFVETILLVFMFAHLAQRAANDPVSKSIQVSYSPHRYL